MPCHQVVERKEPMELVQRHNQVNMEQGMMIRKGKENMSTINAPRKRNTKRKLVPSSPSSAAASAAAEVVVLEQDKNSSSLLLGAIAADDDVIDHTFISSTSSSFSATSPFQHEKADQTYHHLCQSHQNRLRRRSLQSWYNMTKAIRIHRLSLLSKCFDALLLALPCKEEEENHKALLALAKLFRGDQYPSIISSEAADQQRQNHPPDRKTKKQQRRQQQQGANQWPGIVIATEDAHRPLDDRLIMHAALIRQDPPFLLQQAAQYFIQSEMARSLATWRLKVARAKKRRLRTSLVEMKTTSLRLRQAWHVFVTRLQKHRHHKTQSIKATLQYTILLHYKLFKKWQNHVCKRRESQGCLYAMNVWYERWLMVKYVKQLYRRTYPSTSQGKGVKALRRWIDEFRRRSAFRAWRGVVMVDKITKVKTQKERRRRDSASAAVQQKEGLLCHQRRGQKVKETEEIFRTAPAPAVAAVRNEEHAALLSKAMYILWRKAMIRRLNLEAYKAAMLHSNTRLMYKGLVGLYGGIA